jgi:hypothetical protein
MWLIIVAVVIVLLIIIGVVVWLVLRNKSATQQAADAAKQAEESKKEADAAAEKADETGTEEDQEAARQAANKAAADKAAAYEAARIAAEKAAADKAAADKAAADKAAVSEDKTTPTPTPTPPAPTPPTPDVVDVGTELNCPVGRQKIAGLCYENCPDGYTNDGIGNCYQNCPGEWDGTSSLAYCEKKRIFGSAQNLLCPEGEVLRGGLCYPVCKQGYTSDGANVCYQDCPANWDGVSSLANCTKKREYSPAKPLNSCPEGYEMFGSICYAKCPNGGKRTASNTCDYGPYGGAYTNCLDGRITGAPMGAYLPAFGNGAHKTAACTVQTGGLVTSGDFGKTTPFVCPPGYTQKGGLCYANCPAGKQRTNFDLEYCSTICPDGMTDIGAGCQKISYTVGQAPLTEKGVCNTDYEKKGLLCYPKCEAGKQRTDADVAYCTNICPAGMTDIGISCKKQVQRAPSAMLTEVGVCPEGQTKKGLLCYKN